METIQKISLDLHKNSYVYITCKQYNTQDVLEITVMDGADKVDLSGITPKLKIHTPDKRCILLGSEYVTISDDTILVSLPQCVLLKSGKASGEVLLYEGTERISTMNFSIIIVESVYSDDDVISDSDELAAITQITNDCLNYSNSAKSYAVGTDDVVRSGDSTDNAKYYYELTKKLAQSGGSSGGGTTVDTLIPQSLSVTKTKTSYDQGETISTDDLVVQCTYIDALSSEEVNSTVGDYTTNLSSISTYTPGYKSLDIEYEHNGVILTYSIPITVSFSDSYNEEQLAYRVATAGILSNGLELVKCIDKVYKYGEVHLRCKLKITVEQNWSTSYSSFSIKSYDGISYGSITYSPKETGVKTIDVDMTYTYSGNNISSEATLFTLVTPTSKQVQGMFELLDISLAYTKEVESLPVSITATKVEHNMVIGESVSTDDITATVTYNKENTATVTPTVTVPSDISEGENDITVSYSEGDKTVTTTISLNAFNPDRTTADEWDDMTAREWWENSGVGINYGNVLDARGSFSASSTRSDLETKQTSWGTLYTGDGMFGTWRGQSRNQESSWGQPEAEKAHFTELYDMGFRMVRIPITWSPNSYIEANDDGTSKVNDDGFHIRHIGKWYAYRAAQVVQWALDAGLYVLINMHHEQPCIYTNTTKNQMNNCYQDAHSYWSEIADKFKYFPSRLAFEGYNEVDNLAASFQYAHDGGLQMNTLNQIFVDEVRSSGGNNAERVLVCPTLIHDTSLAALNDWEKPTDSATDKIMLNVHCYSPYFLQNLENTFTQLEQAGDEKGAPVGIDEWGTTVSFGTVAERARHAQNFIARAKYHHLYPVVWSNCADYGYYCKTNGNKYVNVMKQFSYSNEILEPIRTAMFKGYNEMKAYAVPSDDLQQLTSSSDFTYKNWNPEKKYYDSGWGNATMSTPIPVTPGKNYSITMVRGEVAQTNTIQLMTVRFLKWIVDEENTEGGYYESVETTNMAWHSYSKSGTIPDEAEYLMVSIGSADKNTTSAIFDSVFSEGFSLDVLMYNESEITEVQLTNRVLSSIISEKVKSIYAVDEEFSDDDITTIATYDDNYSKSVTATYDSSSVDTSKDGDYIIVCSYTEDGVTKTYNLHITVGAVLSNITLSENELYRIKGAEENISSVTVTANNGDGTSEDVTNLSTINDSSVDMDNVGDYVVTYSYTDSHSVTKTADLNVHVVEDYKVTKVADSVYSATDNIKAISPNAIYGFMLSNTGNYRYITFWFSNSKLYTDCINGSIANTNIKESSVVNYFIPADDTVVYTNANEYKDTTVAKELSAPWSYSGNVFDFNITSITDSQGRSWYKLAITPNNMSSVSSSGYAMGVINSNNVPVYYATEDALGIISIDADTKVLTDISVSKTKTTYAIDSTVDTDDITVVATFDNGTTKTLNSSEYSVSTDNVDVTTKNTSSYITVSYTYKDVTKDATIPITITGKQLDSIAAEKTTTTVLVGSTLDTSDITVVATYTDESYSDVTSSATIDSSNVDTSSAGTYKINVSYTEDDITKTTNINISVVSELVVVETSSAVISSDLSTAATAKQADVDQMIWFNDLKSWNYCGMLFNADAIYTDTLTNGLSSFTSDSAVNYYVPASTAVVSYGTNSDLSKDTLYVVPTDKSSVGYKAWATFSNITDSQSRTWLKIAVTPGSEALSTSGYVLGKVFNNTVPVKYCPEANLGNVSL